MGQWYKWQLHMHYHHVWWVVLHLKRVTRILIGPKKHFKLTNCTFISKENFPMRQGNHNLISVSLSSVTNTGQNDFIIRSLLWSNMVKCSTPSSADRFCMDFCGDHSLKAATTTQITIQDIGQLLPGESFIFPYIKTLFPHTERNALQTWFPTSLLKWCLHLIRLTCAVFMHPNTCYQTLFSGLTACNCHSHIYTTQY